MMKNRRFHFPSIAMRGAAAAILVMAGVHAASATTDDEAAALCQQELTGNQGALEVRDIEVRRHVERDHEGVPFVYGNADFADATRVHFRCRVFNEKVTSVSYLVKDPEFVDGRAWSKERPHGAGHHDLMLDEPAKSPPPANPVSPHFERVPQ